MEQTENEFLTAIGCPYLNGTIFSGKIDGEYIDEMMLHVEDQNLRYGKDSQYGYIGRSEDYQDFEINDKPFFKSEEDCQFLTEEQFYACIDCKAIDLPGEAIACERDKFFNPYQISEPAIPCKSMSAVDAVIAHLQETKERPLCFGSDYDYSGEQSLLFFNKTQ